MKKMLKWKMILKSKMDNPDFIEWNIEAIQKELKQNYPDPAYLRQKTRNINEWIDEIEKFAIPFKLGKVV
jgi:hypothetical protein